jgi:hypothetical protein
MVRLTLQSGNRAVFNLVNNFVISEVNGKVCINDGVHNNGGWILAAHHTFDEVVELIEKSKKSA